MISLNAPSALPYARLPQDEKINDTEAISTSLDRSQFTHQQRRNGSSVTLWISWVLIALLTCLNIYQWKVNPPLRDDEQQDIYSPAQSAVKYKQVVTSAGLVHDRSPYQGPPSNATDKLWKELYNFGLTRISIEEASQLVDRTVPIPGEPGKYMVTLSVFHHLHCLNMVRQRIWYDGDGPIPDQGLMGITHLDHCIDGIRQALMCASDVTPRPYGWDPLGQNVVPVNQVLRTCRDFDAIRDWALPRQVHDFNYTIHVEDPLGNVLIDESVRKAWPNGTRPQIP